VHRSGLLARFMFQENTYYITTSGLNMIFGPPPASQCPGCWHPYIPTPTHLW
jgi:hypothetical protein